jgi:hypothetical protein
MLSRVLNALSSLRLTVAVLALGIVLVFLGTVAQEPMGLYLVQKRFFQSFFVDHIALNAALRKASHLLLLNLPPLPPELYEHQPLIPVFPGGYLLGGVLLVNLLVTHLRKLRFVWSKTGIHLTHFGILVLLLGQLFTDQLSVESQISFREGESRSYSEDFAKYELAFLQDLPGTDRDRVIAVPDSLLRTGGELRHEQLPFTVRIQQFHPNASVRRRAPMVDTNREPASTQGAGTRLIVDPATQVRDMDRKNQPAAILEVVGSQGTMGTWALSPLLKAQELGAGQGGWRAELRPVRYYEPFQLTLLKTTHEIYRGTDIPKNFQSRVRIDNTGTGEHREVDVYMNNPLRYAGLTFYQYQMGREQLDDGGRGTSALQVVRNPSWLAPYVSTALVFGGMLLHFLIMLGGFIRRSVSTPRPAA